MRTANESRRTLAKQIGLTGLAATLGSSTAWSFQSSWLAADDDEVVPFTDMANFSTMRGNAQFKRTIAVG